jgi:hypothetical protein
MMHCRMCSQRLTRPGKLCRECEREVQRAQAAAASVDTLSSAVPLIDAAQLADGSSGWTGRLRPRPSVLAVAFAVGMATVAAMYVMQGSQASARPESVMIDRDLSKVTPRDVRAATRAVARDDEPAAAPAAAIAKPADAIARTPVVAVAANAVHAASVTATPHAAAARTPAHLVPAADPAPAAAAPGSRSADDRVLTLAAAVDACARETLFARIACEHRARARYCEGAAGVIPQCAEPPPRDYGQ